MDLCSADELSPREDMFSSEKSRQESKLEKVKEIPLSELHPFHNHPFKVVHDAAMDETAESIREYGVLTPAIAREDPNGGYELIAGHRRHMASMLAGKETMPVLIRNLTDDEATIIMVDTNLQREDILPSERAFAYKMKLEAMNHRGKRSNATCGQVGHKLNSKKSRDILAEQTGDSARNVQRFIRLTNLIPAILDLVDEKRIALNPAYELSFLPEHEQEWLIDAIEKYDATPSHSQAIKLKKISVEGKLTEELIDYIIKEEKQKEPTKLTLRSDTLHQYFPDDYTTQDMHDTIISLLEQWQRQHSRQLER